MDALKLLQELVDAVDAYDKVTTSRQECEFGASPELLKYWEAQDKAKAYLKIVNGPNDDLGNAQPNYNQYP